VLVVIDDIVHMIMMDIMEDLLMMVLVEKEMNKYYLFI
jgi:hypothetical protein